MLRASDADRERIAERLRHATAEGRLLAEELEQRLETAFSARTYGELDALVADLPGTIERRRTSSLRPWIAVTLALALLVPMMLAVVAAVLFVLTGVFAVWMLWVALGWWLFGRGRYHYSSSSARHAGRRVGMYGARRTSARPGFWL
jgi:DUF1707 SHOCT-like domain